AACFDRLPRTGPGGVRPRARRMAGCAIPTRSAGHAPAGATADAKLTFQPDHPVGAALKESDLSDRLLLRGRPPTCCCHRRTDATACTSPGGDAKVQDAVLVGKGFRGRKSCSVNVMAQQKLLPTLVFSVLFGVALAGVGPQAKPVVDL